MTHVAKLFKSGSSQAVRLPLEFRFKGKEVFIHKDPVSGNVVLSPKHTTWDAFFSALESADVPKDFLTEEDRGLYSIDRDLLGDKKS